MDNTIVTINVTREQFENVRAMLDANRRKTRPRKHDLYDVFCGVLYILRTGNTWRSMPPGLPAWRSVHEYFSQWTMQRNGDVTLLEAVLNRLGCEDEAARLRQLTGQVDLANRHGQ